MRKSTFTGLVWGMMLLTFLGSCEKQSENPELSQSVTKFLETRSRQNMKNSYAGQDMNYMSVIAESNFRSGTPAMDGLMIDSAYYDMYYCDTCTATWYETSCATITETDNEDGTHTTVYDYGDGCYEYGWLTKGKISYTWRNEGNTYFSRVEYDQYYSFGMMMEGYSEYSYTSDGNSWFIMEGSTDPSGGETDSSYVYPDYSFYWSGTSSGSDNYTIIFDNGESYSYSSDYANSWDSISSTVLQGYYHYVNETAGYEYTYEVTSPMVTLYSCSNSWVPVSGVETTETTENGQTNAFTIDYGNGTCDNLAVITENGLSYEVNFEELWGKYYDEAVSNGSVETGAVIPGK